MRSTPSGRLGSVIEWIDIRELAGGVALGQSYLFCTLGQHIFHVTLVRHNGDALCWSIGGTAPQAALLLDREMAMVTHFAEPNLPTPTEQQLTAATIRIANLDGRGLAYEHDRYGR